jgi:hypothetical protein
MSVILATQEVEISQIVVPSQPWAKQFSKLYLKKYPTKRAGKVAQAVECLPSKYETPNSNPRTIQKKKIHFLRILTCRHSHKFYLK